MIKKLGLPFDVLQAPQSVFEFYGFRVSDGVPHPGVLFLDACGDVVGKMLGRSPGYPQEHIIIETLKEILKRPTRCGLTA